MGESLQISPERVFHERNRISLGMAINYRFHLETIRDFQAVSQYFDLEPIEVDPNNLYQSIMNFQPAFEYLASVEDREGVLDALRIIKRSSDVLLQVQSSKYFNISPEDLKEKLGISDRFEFYKAIADKVAPIGESFIKQISLDYYDTLHSANEISSQRNIPLEEVYLNDKLYYEAIRLCMSPVQVARKVLSFQEEYPQWEDVEGVISKIILSMTKKTKLDNVELQENMMRWFDIFSDKFDSVKTTFINAYRIIIKSQMERVYGENVMKELPPRIRLILDIVEVKKEDEDDWNYE